MMPLFDSHESESDCMSAAESKIVNIEDQKPKYLPEDEIKWQRDVVVDVAAYNEMSWEDIETYNNGLLGRGVGDAAKLLTTFITKVPEAWGKADDPKTFTKLPRRLLNRLFEHIRDEVSGKN